jgi:hypothetical protein
MDSFHAGHSKRFFFSFSTCESSDPRGKQLPARRYRACAVVQRRSSPSASIQSGLVTSSASGLARMVRPNAHPERYDPSARISPCGHLKPPARCRHPRVCACRPTYLLFVRRCGSLTPTKDSSSFPGENVESNRIVYAKVRISRSALHGKQELVRLLLCNAVCLDTDSR